MKALLKTIFLLISVSAVGVVFVQYRSFQRLKESISSGIYRVSMDCKDWKHPAHSFADYLSIAWMQTDPELKLAFIGPEPNSRFVIAFDLSELIGIYRNGLFFEESGYTFHQLKQELQIKRAASLGDPFSVIKEFRSEKDLLAEMSKMNDGYGLVLFDGSADRYYCAFRGGRSNCQTREKAPEEWTSILDELPDVKKALSIYCASNALRAARIQQIRSKVQGYCGDTDFRLDTDLTPACAIFFAE